MEMCRTSLTCIYEWSRCDQFQCAIVQAFFCVIDGVLALASDGMGLLSVRHDVRLALKGRDKDAD